MKNNLLQAGLAVVIVVLLISLADPFMLVMPQSMVMSALLVIAVLVVAFAGFVLREKAGDERESLHRLHASRGAYILGLAVLTVGLVVEGMSHHVDPWILLALGTMLVAKLFCRVYSENFR